MCEQVRNVVHGVEEHGGFVDVLFFVKMRLDRGARQQFFGLWAILEFDPSDPPTSTNMGDEDETNERMSRHDPSGPMSARWGGNLTIQSLQGPI